jgi:hypothetical protein
LCRFRRLTADHDRRERVHVHLNPAHIKIACKQCNLFECVWNGHTTRAGVRVGQGQYADRVGHFVIRESTETVYDGTVLAPVACACLPVRGHLSIVVISEDT